VGSSGAGERARRKNCAVAAFSGSSNPRRKEKQRTKRTKEKEKKRKEKKRKEKRRREGTKRMRDSLVYYAGSK
jgi:hypothetical protein